MVRRLALLERAQLGERLLLQLARQGLLHVLDEVMAGGGADQYQVSKEFWVSKGEVKGDDTTEAVPQKGERPHLQRLRQGV
jgi:hypothetical protein